MGHILGYKFLEDKNCYSLINFVHLSFGSMYIQKLNVFFNLLKNYGPGIFISKTVFHDILFKFGIHPD